MTCHFWCLIGILLGVERMDNEFVITKRIAKQGNKSIICIPTCLCDVLKPAMLVKVTIQVVNGVEE